MYNKLNIYPWTYSVIYVSDTHIGVQKIGKKNQISRPLIHMLPIIVFFLICPMLVSYWTQKELKWGLGPPFNSFFRLTYDTQWIGQGKNGLVAEI